MEELGIRGDAHRQVMTILVIRPFPAGLQPVTWEGVVQEEDFSSFPPPCSREGNTELSVSPNHRDKV